MCDYCPKVLNLPSYDIKRHMDYDTNVVTVITPNKLAEIREEVLINETWYTLLSIASMSFDLAGDIFWKSAGFKSAIDCYTNLDTKYPNDENFYVHIFGYGFF
jgi:hypothetical protein